MGLNPQFPLRNPSPRFCPVTWSYHRL